MNIESVFLVLSFIVNCYFGLMLFLSKRSIEKYRDLVNIKTELEQSQKRLINQVLELVPSPQKEQLIKVMEETKGMTLEELKKYKEEHFNENN